MPVTKSVEFAKIDTPGLKARPDALAAEGRCRYLNDFIEFEGDEPAGNVIDLLPLPKAALIDPARSFTICPADPGTEFDFGVGEDGDGIADGINLGAGKTFLDESAVELVDASNQRITFTNVNANPVAQRIRVCIAYYVR